MTHFGFFLRWISLKRRFVCISATILASGLWACCPQPSLAQPASSLTGAHNGGQAAENWSSPYLSDSHLSPLEPVLGERDVFPEFTRDMVQLQWRPFDPIHLYVIRPTGVQKPPVILYLYSYPSDTDRFLDSGYCRRVTDKGFAAVGFVSALTGQRYQMRPMRQWFVSELPEAVSSSTHDVQLILNYLATRGDLDLNHIGMFGEGSGATIAILAAAADPRIKALDLINPWGDWKEWLAASTLVPGAERQDYLASAFLEKVATLDPIHWLSQVKGPRIRLQVIMGDPITPDTSLTRVVESAPSHTQVDRYPHIQDYYSANAGGRVFDWIKKQLGKEPEQTPQATRQSTPNETNVSKKPHSGIID